MEKVCIKFLIIAIVLILVSTNDIQIKLTDVIIAIVLFIFLYNLFLIFGKYLKRRRERKDLEIILKNLENVLKKKKTQLTVTYQKK